MERLIDQGQIRYTGVSNFDVKQVKAAQAALRNHKLASNQVLYHLKERGIERKLIPYCQSQGIAVVAYTPFGREKFPRADSPGGKVLSQIAAHHAKTVRQVILNFLTRHDGVFTIPKAGNIEHTRENAGGAGWQLTADDVKAIDAAFPAPTRDTPLAML
jgi:diketogulonate reductase-like aldo/keto reductase